MWMLVISAFVLGLMLGFIAGSMAAWYKTKENLESGMLSYDNNVFLVKRVDKQDLKTIKEKYMKEGGLNDTK